MPEFAVYWIASALGTLARLLTVSGIYGVLSYLVTKRTREIGIRIALGASTRGVAGLVLRQSLRFAIISGAIGTIPAAGASRVLASLANMPMFDSIDTVAFAMGVVLVIVRSAGAAWFRFQSERDVGRPIPGEDGRCPKNSPQQATSIAMLAYHTRG